MEREIRDLGWRFTRTSHIEDGGAPMSRGNSHRLILPDLSAFRHGREASIECKAKTAPRWMDVRKSLVHCMDERVYQHYIRYQSDHGAALIIAIFEANDTVEADTAGRKAGITLAPNTVLCEWLSMLNVRPGTPGHERYYGGKRQVFFNRAPLRTFGLLLGRDSSNPIRQTELFT